MTPLIAPPLSPSLSRAITIAITRGGFTMPIRPRTRRRHRSRPSAFHAYMERVNDDGYPVRDGDRHQGDRPRMVATPSTRATAPAESLQDREARIRYHIWRVAQRL